MIALEPEARLRSVVARINVGVTLHAADGAILFANEAAQRILGKPRAVLPARGWIAAGQDCIDETGQAVSPDREPLALAFAQRAAVRDMVIGLRAADAGEREWLLVSADPLLGDQGQVVEVVCTFSDITEQRRAHERIRHLAHHDGLTQLPNRELLMDRLGVALAQARRREGCLALVFVDLDHFKVINDSLGHSMGDSVLRTLALRLSGAVRKADTVARLGGDEFTLLLPVIETPADVSRVLREVRDALRRPIALDDREISVSASMGVAMFPMDAQDAETLLKHSDTAMYRAKELGRDQTEFYTPELGARVRWQLDVDARLRRALTAGELVLHYQPVIELQGGTVSGFEALVRWRHPSGRLIPPAEFVPAAEAMGAIQALGVWVLNSVCKSMATLATLTDSPPIVAVNLSARQLQSPDIVEVVRGAIEDAGCDPAQIELEITESAALHGQEATIERLRELNAVGVRLAIDDFGTGFSSFAYLQRYPIHTLKVDKSFVQDMTSSRSGSGITRAIVAVGRELGLRVVAEGVENEAQLRQLRLLGCDAIQGYLFATPVPLEELAAATIAVGRAWHRHVPR